MIEGKIFSGEEGYKQTGFLRYKIFCEEFSYTPELEHDFLDFFSYHLAIIDHNQIIGASRLYFQNDRFIIDRLCVEKTNRNQGIADMMIRMLSLKSMELGAKEVYTFSKDKFINYYKSIGFMPSGDKTMHLGEEMNCLVLRNHLQRGCDACSNLV